MYASSLCSQNGSFLCLWFTLWGGAASWYPHVSCIQIMPLYYYRLLNLCFIISGVLLRNMEPTFSCVFIRCSVKAMAKSGVCCWQIFLCMLEMTESNIQNMPRTYCRRKAWVYRIGWSRDTAVTEEPDISCASVLRLVTTTQSSSFN